MANQEQLNILKQGVKVWNKWREENLDAKIDLQGTILVRANLQGANLQGANLRGADLTEVNLRKADLRGATLLGADLREADLSEAILFGVDLRGSDLREATLFGVDLREAILYGADLSNANLCEAKLYETDLGRTKLCNADLRGANLCRVNLRGVDLCGVNLNKTFLREANLREANLSGVEMIEAKLGEARLIKANLSQAILTGAELYGTARDDWSIDGILCDFVYWGEKRECRVPKDKDSNFRPGEFEERYKSLPTFEYYFEQGFTPLDPLIMDRVVQAINEQHKEFKLDLVNFDKRGQPHATFTVCQMEFKEAAQQQVTADYERRLAALEGKQELVMELLTQVVNNPKTVELIMGDKRMIQAGRDYFEDVDGNAQVHTGASDSETDPAGRSGTS